jgi:hypothetical protein
MCNSNGVKGESLHFSPYPTAFNFNVLHFIMIACQAEKLARNNHPKKTPKEVILIQLQDVHTFRTNLVRSRGPILSQQGCYERGI